MRNTVKDALSKRAEQINGELRRYGVKFRVKKVERHDSSSGRKVPARHEVLGTTGHHELIPGFQVVVFDTLKGGSGDLGKQIILCNNTPGIELVIVINGKWIYYTREYRIPLQSVVEETPRGWSADLPEKAAAINLVQRHASFLAGENGIAEIKMIKKMTKLLENNSSFSDGRDSFWLVCCQTKEDITFEELENALLDNNKNEVVIPVLSSIEDIDGAVDNHIVDFDYNPSTEKSLQEIDGDEESPEDRIFGGLFDVAIWFVFKYKFLKPMLKELWPDRLEELESIFN